MTTSAIPSPRHTPGRAASEVLEELAEAFQGEKITVGELIDELICARTACCC